MSKTDPQVPPRGKLKSHMSAKEYRAALDALGLTIRSAGKFLRVTDRTATRRASGEAPISFETAALLRLMLKLKIKPAAANVLVRVLTVGEKAN